MSVRSSLFVLFLTERHRSQNQGLLKSEERLSDFKERCAQLCDLHSVNHLPASTVAVRLYKCQSWALALYFQVRSPLSTHFISMDRYRSSAHLANFQVRSSLYRSQKNQWFALGKER